MVIIDLINKIAFAKFRSISPWEPNDDIANCEEPNYYEFDFKNDENYETFF